MLLCQWQHRAPGATCVAHVVHLVRLLVCVCSYVFRADARCVMKRGEMVHCSMLTQTLYRRADRVLANSAT